MFLQGAFTLDKSARVLQGCFFTVYLIKMERRFRVLPKEKWYEKIHMLLPTSTKSRKLKYSPRSFSSILSYTGGAVLDRSRLVWKVSTAWL